MPALSPRRCAHSTRPAALVGHCGSADDRTRHGDPKRARRGRADSRRGAHQHVGTAVRDLGHRQHISDRSTRPTAIPPTAPTDPGMLCSWDRYLSSNLIGGCGRWATGALGGRRRCGHHRCDAAGSSSPAHGMHTAGDHPPGDPTTRAVGTLAVVQRIGGGMPGNNVATHRSTAIAASQQHLRPPGKTMHHRGVATRWVFCHRMAGDREQP
jgi:hypothetical protein